MDRLSETLEVDVGIAFPGFSLRVTESFPAGVTTLFGPNGAGKSTLLRIIAGLETRAEGKITFQGQVWQDSQARRHVPAHSRGATLVFQDSRLFSHMDVAANLKYGLKRRQGRGGPAWEEVCAALDLEQLLMKPVGSVSGGERQRIAIGRALLASPRLLLLDEPISALDAKRMRAVLPALWDLFNRHGISVVFVSHTIDELRRLGCEPLQMNQGQIASWSWPGQSGEKASLKATVAALRADGTAVCRIGAQELLARHSGNLSVGELVELSLDPGNIVICMQKPNGLISAGLLEATLLSADYGSGGRGDAFVLQCSGGAFKVQYTFGHTVLNSLTVGQSLFAVAVRPVEIIGRPD